LLSLKQSGWDVEQMKTMKNDKVVEEPAKKEASEIFGKKFEVTKVDKLMLQDELEFTIEDKGIWIGTNKGEIPVEFDLNRFRHADVPILMSDTGKIEKLGFGIQYKLEDIIRDQLNYFMKKENRV
jgi:GDPmannose 4,6-dehydratase